MDEKKQKESERLDGLEKKREWLDKRERRDKREKIAIVLLSGLLANPNKWYGPRMNLAELALEYADALIEALAKEKGDKIPIGGDLE